MYGLHSNECWTLLSKVNLLLIRLSVPEASIYHTIYSPSYACRQPAIEPSAVTSEAQQTSLMRSETSLHVCKSLNLQFMTVTREGFTQAARLCLPLFGLNSSQTFLHRSAEAKYNLPILEPNSPNQTKFHIDTLQIIGAATEFTCSCCRDTHAPYHPNT